MTVALRVSPESMLLRADVSGDERGLVLSFFATISSALDTFVAMSAGSSGSGGIPSAKVRDLIGRNRCIFCRAQADGSGVDGCDAGLPCHPGNRSSTEQLEPTATGVIGVVG